ncbi:type VI immunity family protein [uncultured Martelella sp.]|uniref:type VI immunity family protein n=1 Tax=uncultured Martelella sp. TaxID=392331 RepID=UPI0029C8E7AB|nr:type VI immunity family protein [uncultured Martelella sp.]
MEIPTDLKLDPKDIETRGILRSQNAKKIKSRVGILVSIYFLEGWKPEKRSGLFQCANDYMTLFTEDISYYHYGDQERAKKWKTGANPEDLKEHVTASSESDDVYFDLFQFDKAEDSDPGFCRFMAFAFPKEKTWHTLSGIKAHFPPSFVFSSPDRFVEIIRQWSERVGAIHGSAGLGALSMPGSETSVTEAYYYPWLMQYPALEYDAMGDYWDECEEVGESDKPRSSNWLTILGRPNLDRLGGYVAVESQLTKGMTMYYFEGGALIRASELPALGDEATGGIPEGYRTAARIIKPIRFEGYKYGVILEPFDVDGPEITLEWIRRFD